jgi:hypothetical protein
MIASTHAAAGVQPVNLAHRGTCPVRPAEGPSGAKSIRWPKRRGLAGACQRNVDFPTKRNACRRFTTPHALLPATPARLFTGIPAIASHRTTGGHLQSGQHRRHCYRHRQRCQPSPGAGRVSFPFRVGRRPVRVCPSAGERCQRQRRPAGPGGRTAAPATTRSAWCRCPMSPSPSKAARTSWAIRSSWMPRAWSSTLSPAN